MKYSDFFYIPKEQISREEIIKNLRIFGKGKDDNPLIRDCWKETDEFWLVPRFWGTAKFSGKNQTKKPKSSWVKKKEFLPRYNQQELIEDSTQLLKDEFGCRVEAQTGFGKTACCLQVASNLKTKVLVIVDKEDLADQWKNEFETWFEGSVGLVRGDSLDYDHPLTIATSQTLYSRRDTLPADFWKAFGCIIVDEGHSFSAKSFYTSVNKFHARYRLACSATWRRKDELDPLWDLAISDKVVIGVRTDNLERKYKIVYKNFGFRKGQFFNRWTGQPDFNLILKALAENDQYNGYLANLLAEMVAQGRNPVLACKRVHQVEELYKRLSPIFEVGVYSGTFEGKTVKKEELQKAKDAQIILATFGKIEKGTDIKRLDTMIIASPISDQEQLIGRIARQSEGKTSCEVYDIRFPEIPFTNKGDNQRDTIYRRLRWQRIE